jgi:hypothetical protein
VVGDQAGEAVVTELSEPSGTVEGVKAAVDERGCVADVMKIGGRHQDFVFRGFQEAPDALRLCGDRLAVHPSFLQAPKVLLCLSLRPRVEVYSRPVGRPALHRPASHPCDLHLGDD